MTKQALKFNPDAPIFKDAIVSAIAETVTTEMFKQIAGRSVVLLYLPIKYIKNKTIQDFTLSDGINLDASKEGVKESLIGSFGLSLIGVKPQQAPNDYGVMVVHLSPGFRNLTLISLAQGMALPLAMFDDNNNIEPYWVDFGEHT